MLLRVAPLCLPLITLPRRRHPRSIKLYAHGARSSLQYHVEGKFTKAFEYVAEDTKEYYFNSQKGPVPFVPQLTT